MKWCCVGFESFYPRIEERGTSIAVGRSDSGDLEFYIQHRAVNKGMSLRDTEGVAVSLISRSAISFCPWCGRSLRRWYRRYEKDLRRDEELTEAHI